MKRLITLLAAALVACPAAAQSPSRQVEQLQVAAMAGNYQAQRNLAYILGNSQTPQGVRDPKRACSWRIAILLSGHREADISDLMNFRAACLAPPLEWFPLAQNDAAELLKALGVARFQPLPR